MSRIILSNTAICGPLDANAPNVIAREIYFDHFDSSGNEIQQMEVEYPLRDDDFPILASFLNPNVAWPRPKLIEAFNNHRPFLVPFESVVHEDIFTEIPSLRDRIGVGLPTPQNPLTLKPACLFRICKLFHLPTTSSTTIPQMLHMIEHINTPPTSLKLKIDEHLDRLNTQQLISVLSSVLTFEQDRESDEQKETPALDQVMAGDFVDASLESNPDQSEQSSSHQYQPCSPSFYDRAITTFNDLDNKSYLLRRIIPKTSIEACLLAAINFQYDLTDAKDVLLEYSRLASQPYSYIPGDPGMSIKFQQDEYSYRLDYTFNPHLPKSFYGERTLKELAIEEGFVEDDFRLSEPYELLQFGTLSSTFYHGKLSTITNVETPILCEQIELLDSCRVLCYGVKDEALVAFTYDELTRFWRQQYAFTNPVCLTDSIEPRCIRKLRKLCTYIRGSDTTESMKARQDMYDCILFIESFIQEKGQHGLQLLRSFRQASDVDKRVYRLIFLALVELIMYMRGWNGDSDFEEPVLRATVDNQNDVDTRVTEALSRFESLCSEHTQIGRQILDLPLLKYRGSQFIAVSDSSQGQTIGERLELVKQGDQADVLASCIRVSSNLLGASYYRYASILGFPKEFEISSLRNIS